MKTMDFVIFLSVALLIYFSVNLYIFIRGWQSLSGYELARKIYAYLFIFLSMSYIIGRLLERFFVCRLSSFMIWTGSFWLGMMLYLLLIIVFIDLVRLADRFAGFIPQGLKSDAASGPGIFVSVLSLSAIIVLSGFINTQFPRIHNLELDLKKPSPKKEVKIVMVTDIHLGIIIRNSKLIRMVEAINNQDPDLVILGGDIIDEDLKPVLEQNIGDTLKTIKSRLGIYAVMGNHEYIGGAEDAYDYLRGHNIKMLRDECVFLDGSFYLIGREDYTRQRFTGLKRKTLAGLMSVLDRRRPLIVVDHQPFSVRESAGEGADVHLSGHTHNGQMWPFNHIVNMIYDVGCGYRRISGTHVYVSNGFGTWGPPVRVGNRPEIVVIKIRFSG